MVIPAIFILLIVAAIAVVMAKLYTSANRERIELRRENKSLIKRYEPIVQTETLQRVKVRFPEPSLTPEPIPEPEPVEVAGEDGDGLESLVKTLEENGYEVAFRAYPKAEPEPEPEPIPEPEKPKKKPARKRKKAAKK